ncbi:MAG TPA: hypothetical protein VF711_00880, partial [Acidimicrobiales bacterium]
DFGVYAFDAANIVIDAAEKALAGTTAVTPRARAGTLAAVQHTDRAGASGRLGFDQFGDTRTKVLTLYRVVEGGWKPVKTETVS